MDCFVASLLAMTGKTAAAVPNEAKFNGVGGFSDLPQLQRIGLHGRTEKAK
jgi:hypothetical protein